jgi:hypothetical protein
MAPKNNHELNKYLPHSAWSMTIGMKALVKELVKVTRRPRNRGY